MLSVWVLAAACVWRARGISVMRGDGSVLHFHQQTANFGAPYGTFDTSAPLALAQPLLACDPLQVDHYAQAVLLVLRGNCSFVQKVWHAQQAGAVGVIVGNSLENPEAYVFMAKADLPAPDNLPGHLADHIKIPAQFVLHSDFVQMSKIVTETEGRAMAQMNSNDEVVSEYSDPLSNLRWFRLISTILVFAPTFWCCLAAMFVIIRNAVRSHVDRNRRLRVLTCIPEMVFNNSMLENRDQENWITGNTCSICLDDFVHEVTVIKRLGCAHAFHPGCIDVWLSKQSDKCPVCRESVLVSTEAVGQSRSSCSNCWNRLFNRGDQIEYREVVQMESPVETPVQSPL